MDKNAQQNTATASAEDMGSVNIPGVITLTEDSVIVTFPRPTLDSLKANVKGNAYVTVAAVAKGTFAIGGHAMAFRNAILNFPMREVLPGKSDASPSKTARRFTFGRK